jgi:two-component system nitrogen regulation response regulator NtrX
VALQKPPLTLDAFARSPLLKDLKKRLEQAAAKTSVLLLKSASGSIAEICARTLQDQNAVARSVGDFERAADAGDAAERRGGIVFIADLMLLGKLQQMNLVFALERLEKHNLQLVAASTRSLPGARRSGWEPPLLVAGWAKSGWPCRSSRRTPTTFPEIAALLLAHLAERGEVPPRRFSSGALRTRCVCTAGRANGPELLTAVKNLALSALEEEIRRRRARILQSELPDGEAKAPLLPFFDQPLREAREAFERLYFEHHLRRTRQHDAFGGKDGARAHPPLPQVEAAGSEDRPARRRIARFRRT